MSLAVIGAGLGRTGTLSMKLALETLGFAPCHHMLEVTSSDSQRAIWRKSRLVVHPIGSAHSRVIGQRWTGQVAYFWRELAAYYPAAKVILTRRSPESWWQSMCATILPTIAAHDDPNSVGVKLIAERVFSGVLDDRAHALRIYAAHNAAVTAAIPPERLLVYELGDGWAPLCRFLGVAVPEQAFPRANSNAGISSADRRPGEPRELMRCGI